MCADTLPHQFNPDSLSICYFYRVVVREGGVKGNHLEPTTFGSADTAFFLLIVFNLLQSVCRAARIVLVPLATKIAHTNMHCILEFARLIAPVHSFRKLHTYMRKDSTAAISLSKLIDFNKISWTV